MNFLSRGFFLAGGVFETLRAYKGKVPFLDLHIERLNKGLKSLEIDEAQLDFQSKISELLKLNNLDDVYIRITAYKKRESTGVIIYVDKFGYYPESAYEKGFTTIVSPHKRDSKNHFPQIKSLSYLENRMSWYEAQKKNKDEALILNEGGFLVGGSRSNLFIVKNNEVFIPSLEKGAFGGITRNVVIKILKDLKIKVKEKNLEVESLFSYDEAFLTSALLEVMPLVECQDKKIGGGKPGAFSLTVLAKYRELCNKSNA